VAIRCCSCSMRAASFTQHAKHLCDIYSRLCGNCNWGTGAAATPECPESKSKSESSSESKFESESNEVIFVMNVSSLDSAPIAPC